jgi:hypothetical protein
VLLVLRAMGAAMSPLMLIAVVAPLFTPWSLGYLFDRCGVAAGLLIVMSNAVLGVVAAVCVGETGSKTGTYPVSTPESGLLGILRNAGRSLNGTVIAIVTLACVGTGVVSLFVPPNALGDMMVDRSGDNLLLVSAATWLSYMSSDIVAMRSGEVANASTMPGLIVSVIALGGVLHIGTLIAAIKVRWQVVPLVISAALLLTIVVDRPLFDEAYEPEDTHAFEDVGRPFHLLDHPQGAVAGFSHRLHSSVNTGHYVAMLGVVLLAAWGTLARPRTTAESSPISKVAMMTGLWAVASLAAFVYSYYPTLDLLKSELRAKAAEVGSTHRTGPTPDSVRAARQIDRRLSQLSMIELLRGQTLSEEVRMLKEELTPFSPDGSADLDRQKKLLRLLSKL